MPDLFAAAIDFKHVRTISDKLPIPEVRLTGILARTTDIYEEREAIKNGISGRLAAGIETSGLRVGWAVRLVASIPSD